MRGLGGSAVLAEVGARHDDAGIETLALAWLMRLSGRPFPGLGTTQIERLRRAALAKPVNLSRQDLHWILEASSGLK